MAVVRVTEHRKKIGGCGYRWVYQGGKTKDICCPKCGKKFNLTEKDKRILKKVEKMNREKG